MIKAFLRRFPPLYTALHRAFYGILYFSERHFLGTRLNEWLWRHRRFEDSARKSIEHPHRAFLRDRLLASGPVESALEIGCNAGPNLVVLGRALPSARLAGIDISEHAIEAARGLLVEQGIRNASVQVGFADDLSAFPDKSFDVVFSDATIIYVGPDKILRTLGEMLRVARNRVVLNEWHLFPGSADVPPGTISHWYYARWIHDYRALFAQLRGTRDVHVEPVPKGHWGDAGWDTFGAVIDVRV